MIIYLIGQSIFFINTERTKGQVCDITEKSGSDRYPGKIEIFYACFEIKDSTTVRFKAGKNLGLNFGDTVNIIYKRNNPVHARLTGFLELWVLPGVWYLFPFAVIMGLVTAMYYGNRYVVINKKPFKLSYIPEKQED